MCDGLKDILYKPVKFDSRNLEKFGNAIGWDWLEEEANTNVDNPGRAVGKAATFAALWYLGGGAWGSAGSTAANAAGAAAQAGMQTAAGMTAEELAKIAAEEMMRESLMGTAQAGLQGAKEAAPSLMGGMMQPQGLLNTMEAGMTETGYVPSSLLNAFKNTGETNPLMQNMQNFGMQQGQELMGGNGMGLLNRASSNMADSKNREVVKMGMNMMNPQEPQQPMPMAPPPRQAQQEPLQSPYGNPMDTPPPGISPEEWERLKMQLMMGRR